MNTATKAAAPSSAHRTSAMAFTPGGGASSPSLMRSCSSVRGAGGGACGPEGSMDTVASAELLGVEWVERTQRDVRADSCFEVGERVIEIGASHHDVVLDVDHRPHRVEHRH